MRDLDERARQIARGRRPESTATARATTADDGIPDHVKAKLRQHLKRLPTREARAGFGRRLLELWMDQRNPQVARAGNMPSKAQAKAGMAILTALDEAGAFDE